MDCEKFDNSIIEAEALDIPEKDPRITLKALEYLEDYKEV